MGIDFPLSSEKLHPVNFGVCVFVSFVSSIFKFLLRLFFLFWGARAKCCISCLALRVLLNDVIGLRFCVLVLNHHTTAAGHFMEFSLCQLYRCLLIPVSRCQPQLGSFGAPRSSFTSPTWMASSHLDETHKDGLGASLRLWQFPYFHMLGHWGRGQSSAPLVKPYERPLHLQQQCLPGPRR